MRAVFITLLWVGFLAMMPDGVPAQDAGDSPQAVVQATSDRMLSVLKRNREEIEAHPDRLYGLVSDIVLPHFDFTRMAQWVLGKYWRRVTDEQKQDFTGAFRNLLVHTYSTALLEYTDLEIQYLPLRMDQDARDATVRTEVIQGNGSVVPINYRMYLSPEGWKVYDVTVEGISLVTNYRSTFSNEIRLNGMDALIERLQQRNQQDNRS